MPSERDTAMMDEAYALYGYHDMVRHVDRPPPYAVAVRSSRQCPAAAAAAAASSTATSADTSACPPSGSGTSNR